MVNCLEKSKVGYDLDTKIFIRRNIAQWSRDLITSNTDSLELLLVTDSAMAELIEDFNLECFKSGWTLFGWVSYTDLLVSDEVLTLSNTNEKVWSRVTKISFEESDKSKLVALINFDLIGMDKVCFHVAPDQRVIAVVDGFPLRGIKASELLERYSDKNKITLLDKDLKSVSVKIIEELRVRDCSTWSLKTENGNHTFLIKRDGAEIFSCDCTE